jgi:hypothetical protein
MDFCATEFCSFWFSYHNATAVPHKVKFSTRHWFSGGAVKVLGKLSGKLIFRIYVSVYYITQQLYWTQKINAFRDVIFLILVDRHRRLERTCCHFYQAEELFFFLKMEASSFCQGWYIFTKVHGVTCQKVALLTVTIARISDHGCLDTVRSPKYIWKGPTWLSIIWLHSSLRAVFYGQVS